MSRIDAIRYFNEANVCLRRGQHAEAVRLYTKALAIDPQYWEALGNRATARYILRDDPGALQDFEASIRLRPGDPLAFANRALVKERLGDFQGAIDDYSEALRLHPRNEVARVNRGSLRLKLGDARGAEEDANPVASASKDPVVLESALWTRGHARALLGRVAEGLKDLDEAVRAFPKSHAPFLHRGQVYFEQKQHDKAAADLDRAVLLDDHCEDAWFARGTLRLATGAREQALQDFDAGIRSYDDHHCEESARLWKQWRDSGDRAALEGAVKILPALAPLLELAAAAGPGAPAGVPPPAPADVPPPGPAGPLKFVIRGRHKVLGGQIELRVDAPDLASAVGMGEQAGIEILEIRQEALPTPEPPVQRPSAVAPPASAPSPAPAATPAPGRFPPPKRGPWTPTPRRPGPRPLPAILGAGVVVLLAWGAWQWWHGRTGDHPDRPDPLARYSAWIPDSPTGIYYARLAAFRDSPYQAALERKLRSLPGWSLHAEDIEEILIMTESRPESVDHILVRTVRDRELREVVEPRLEAVEATFAGRPGLEVKGGFFPDVDVARLDARTFYFYNGSEPFGNVLSRGVPGRSPALAPEVKRVLEAVRGRQAFTMTAPMNETSDLTMLHVMKANGLRAMADGADFGPEVDYFSFNVVDGEGAAGKVRESWEKKTSEARDKQNSSDPAERAEGERVARFAGKNKPVFDGLSFHVSARWSWEDFSAMAVSDDIPLIGKPGF